jgi:hypothetical protein
MVNNAHGGKGVYKPMKFSFLFLLPVFFGNNVGQAQPASPTSLLNEISFYADVMVNASRDDHRALAYNRMNDAMDAFLITEG